MTDVQHPTPGLILIDDNGRIDQDLPCIACGYNLRGMTDTTMCPECGVAVGRSMRGDFLRFCDPRWVGQLAKGMNFIVASIVATILFIPIAIGLTAATTTGNAAQQMEAIASIIALGISLLALIGYILLTTADPIEPIRGTSTTRVVARFALIFWFAMQVVGISLQLAGQRVIGEGVEAFSGIANLVGTIALCVYAYKLALRIPNESLARQIGIVTWGYGITLGILVVMGIPIVVAVQLFGTGAVGTVALIASGFACVAGFGALVFGIWAIVLIVWFRREVAQASEHALATWASAPAR